MKHFVVTLENGHWPMTFETTEVTEAYECVANILDSMDARPGHKTDFMLALVRMDTGDKQLYSSQGIRVQLADGEV